MDKRKHQRFIKRLTAQFRVDHESFSGISSDISENGIFLRTSRAFPVNTSLDIELSLPDNKVAFLKGIVKRTSGTSFSTKNGVGVEIIKKDKLFADFLKSLTGIKQSPSHVKKNTVPEKRQHRRFSVADMDIHGEMSFAKRVKIINISLDGIMVKTDRRLDMGNKYRVKIEYRDKTFIAKAAVMWSLLVNGMEDTGGNLIPLYLAGMQFTDISNRNKREEIVHLIEADAREDMIQSPACRDNGAKPSRTNGDIRSENYSITEGNDLPSDIPPQGMSDDPDTGSSGEICLKIADIYSRYKNKTLNYYEILDVDDFADRREIKKAYYMKVRELHPDRYADLSPEMKGKLNDLLAYLNEAYKILMNCPDKGSLVSQQSANISNRDLAKREFEKGKIEFWNGCMSEAGKFFQNAIYLDNTSPRYFFFYAKTLQNLGNLQAAEKAIRNALKIDPSNSDYLVEAGNIYHGMGLTYRARENFEMALRIQPSNTKALEGMNELRNKNRGVTGDNTYQPVRMFRKIVSRQI